MLSKLFPAEINATLLGNRSDVNSDSGSGPLLPAAAQPFCVGDNGDFTFAAEERDAIGPFQWQGLPGNDSMLYHEVVDERNPFGLGSSNGAGVRGPTGETYPAPAYPIVLPNRNYTLVLGILAEMERAEYFDL